MSSPITRTAKSAKGKVALTLLGVLAALSIGVFAYAKAAKPDFSIRATPGKRTVQAGKSTSYVIKVKRLRRFKGAVTLGVKGLPAGARARWAGARKTHVAVAAKANVIKKNVKSATLTIVTSSTTPAGTTKPTITAKSGRRKHSKKITLVVVPAAPGGPVGGGATPPAQTTFAIAASPGSKSIPQSDVASYDVTINRGGGYTGPVRLTVTGLPGGASVPASSAGGSSATLTVDTRNSTPTGSYPLVITGTGTNGVTSTAGVTLVVTRNLPFAISSSAVSGLAPGASVPVDLSLHNPNPFTIKVTSLTIGQPAITSSNPGCVAAENFAGGAVSNLSIEVPGGQTVSLSGKGIAPANMPHVQMKNTDFKQDACKGATLSLPFSGSAAK